MTDPNTIENRRRRGWWGYGGEYMQDQGCLGCGAAWWLVMAVIVCALFFWGWGFTGYGGWGGWGWRSNPCGTTTTTSAPR